MTSIQNRKGLVQHEGIGQVVGKTSSVHMTAGANIPYASDKEQQSHYIMSAIK